MTSRHVSTFPSYYLVHPPAVTVVYKARELQDNQTIMTHAKPGSAKLIKARSKINPDRFLTNPNYVNLWDGKIIEFPNFNDEEIANAMTQVSENRYSFVSSEIALCRSETDNQDKDTLSQLYKDKLDYGLEKPKLLKILFDNVLAHPENEHDDNGSPKRQVVKFLQDIIQLASKNHQPVNSEIWKKNQDSGYFGKHWPS